MRTYLRNRSDAIRVRHCAFGWYVEDGVLMVGDRLFMMRADAKRYARQYAAQHGGRQVVVRR